MDHAYQLIAVNGLKMTDTFSCVGDLLFISGAGAKPLSRALSNYAPEKIHEIYYRIVGEGWTTKPYCHRFKVKARRAEVRNGTALYLLPCAVDRYKLVEEDFEENCLEEAPIGLEITQFTG